MTAVGDNVRNRNPSGPEATPDHFAEPQSAANRVFELMSSRKVDAAIFAMRFATVICSLLYMVPTFKMNGTVTSRLLYERALLASAAAGALRMHQLTADQNFRVSQALGDLCRRDVTQFFMFALLFIYNSRRMTIVIIPLMLYHLLEGLNYCRELLQVIGVPGRSAVFTTMRRLEEYRDVIMQFIAWLEIWLIALLFGQCLYGGVTLFQLILYYRYIVLRYSAFSPYCRRAFAVLHAGVQTVREWPDWPEEVRTAIDRIVNFVRWLEPPNVGDATADTPVDERSGDTSANGDSQHPPQNAQRR